MDTKFIKSALEKKKAQNADLRISPIAGTIFRNLSVVRRTRRGLG
jgi:hypothetical protein